MKSFKNILTICFVLFATVLLAQKAEFTIKGKVVEIGTSNHIDYATIIANVASTGEMLSGTTTDNGGEFELTVSSTDVEIELSFIGFTTKTIRDIQFENKIANLGIIELGEDAQTLDEVVVTAEKSTTEFKLDKRVFNVGTDLSSTGASALEVLNNVPSVNVNIEGQVSLRGASGVQMLINGKPSVLADESGNALGSITADMIEKVEVITNPSAKYEAEGTAGIINIILKKEEKRGMNGSLSLNTGTPHNHSVGLSLNRRTEKFNLFSQLGMGYRELPNDNENINRDLVRNSELVSTGEEFRNETFYNVILGSDYYINPLNVITLSGSFSYEVEDQPSETSFSLLSNGEEEKAWTRTEDTEATNPKFQYEFNYKRDFEDNKEHQLLFSAIGNFFGKDQASVFTNRFTAGIPDQGDQQTETSFKEGKYTFKLDYTKPFMEKWTLETGAQYLTNHVSNEFAVRNEVEDEFVVDENLTNLFEYDQDVLGVYTTTAFEDETWGVKLGLRVEHTNLSTLLVNTNEENAQNFTNLFPSAHTSYKISDAISVQGGYSRRIYRPRLWDLNPFFNIRNNFSVRAGNPNLLPEYTDSYEVGSIFIFSDVSLNVNAYHRYTTDKIERVSTFENNVNIFRPENIGTNRATGLEVNFKYTPIKKLTLNGDANYNVFSREGSFNDQIFDFSADQWSSKFTTKYKVSKALDVEVTARHESREQTIQGTLAANTFADLGMRFKILKGRGIFNFSVRDVFASRIRQNTVDQPEFFLFSSRQRGRFITFGFSYGFGKGEAMEYSGRRRR
ncbi:MAG: TonB-dependent receptor [Saprospiraceae bacterium]|nr:TonB-dependent receptor [Saprospiraceae bacterium]